MKQRNGQPCSGNQPEPLGEFRETAVAFRAGRVFIQADDPTALLEKTDKRAIDADDGSAAEVPSRNVPGGGWREFADVTRQPQGSFRASHDVANGLDDAAAQILSIGASGGRLDEAQPLFTIVVPIFEKALLDKDAQICAESGRRNRNKQEQDRADEENRLQKGAPCATEAADIVARRRHGHQVKAGAKKGGGVEYELP